MPKKLQLLPSHFYHIFNRGNNRQHIFRENENYKYFIRLAKRHIIPVCDVYCYALLPNHFHLIAKIKSEVELARLNISNSTQISRKFGNWFNAYAKAFNKRYSQVSSLFEDRFERIPINRASKFTQLVCYVHWNPQKHGYVRDFKAWEYTSYHSLIYEKSTFLQRDYILKWVGGKFEFIKAHDQPRRSEFGQ